MSSEPSITLEQLRIMRHAVGWPDKSRYRNYFYLYKGGVNHKQWQDLEQKGLATSSKGWDAKGIYYSVTEEGLRFID